MADINKADSLQESKESLTEEYYGLLHKLMQLKKAVVRNHSNPNYPIVKKSYWECREKANWIADQLGIEFVELI